MILGFMQKFPWKVNGQPEPTNFREKILAGVDKDKVTILCSRVLDLKNLTAKTVFLGELKPKLHTIREDKHNRWKAGRKIEMVYRGAGYKIIDHFNKGIPELEKCVSVQKIRIQFNNNVSNDLRPCGIYIDEKLYFEVFVTPNGNNSCKTLDRQMLEQFCKNDGFKDSIQFFRWFKKDFSGKIIHFSNLRY